MPSLSNHPSSSLAIQNWLLHSAFKASDQGSPQGCNRDLKALNSAGSTQEQPTCRGFPGLDGDPSEEVMSRTISMARQEPLSRRSPWEPGLDDENLPQRLGLHAPFRPFGRRSNDMDVDHHSNPTSARKRKRNLLSTSSDVEPAIFQNHTKLKTNGRVHRSITSIRVNTESEESVSDSDNALSENIYKRKPRRKTREDRYDFKQDIYVKNPRKRIRKSHGREIDGKRRARKRRAGERRNGERRDEERRDGKRRKKSGSAIMHEYVAKNVAAKRLTLISAATSGLFNKGRASSPVRRRGLPDLSFSELSFLKSKKEKLNDTIKDKIEKSQPKRDNDWDAGTHISRYFASRKSVDHSKCFSGPETSKLSGRATYPRSGHTDRNATPADFINISEKSCLGFESSKGDLISPARNIGRTTNSQSPKPLSTRTASLVSWSVSGISSHNDSIDRDIKNSSDDAPNVRTNIKVDHLASLTGEEPSDSVPSRRKVIHSSAKVANFDGQREELSGFMPGNALSENTMTQRAGVPEPQAKGREKRAFVKELAFSGQNNSPNQELQAPFAAAPKSCPRNCKFTTLSPHGTVRSKATNPFCLPEKPDYTYDGNRIQRNNNIQASTNECVYKDLGALYNGFFDPHLKPGALSFELRTDQPEEQLNLGLIDHCHCIPQYNHPDAYTSDYYGGPDKLCTGLRNHEFCTSDAFNNHENPTQRCFQMRNLTNGGFDERGYYQRGNGCSGYINRLAGLENYEASTVTYNPGQFTSYEHGAIGDHGYYSLYGRNESTQLSEELSIRNNEENTESAIHEMGEPPSRFSAKNETTLDAEARYVERLLQESMNAGHYSALEDGHEDFHEDLLDPELDPAAFPQDKTRSNERLLQDKCCDESFILRCDTWGGAVNSVNISQMMATSQPNDGLVIPGFWKPQKLY